MEIYLAGAAERWAATRRPDQPEIDAAGVRGLLCVDDDSRVRLKVTDDRARAVLSAVLFDARAGVVDVFASAPECAQLLGRSAQWTAQALTAMVCRDLPAVPEIPLPAGLIVRPVCRTAQPAPDTVALDDAAALALLANPGIADSPARFAESVRSLPREFRLLAAVDRRDAVRATSGGGVFGRHATVLFVNTHPEWRGRGIALAMTAAALRASHDRGAAQACLDATGDGLSIYGRLGFEIAGLMTGFSRPG